MPSSPSGMDPTATASTRRRTQDVEDDQRQDSDRDSAVVRTVTGTRLRARLREMRAAVERMERAVTTDQLPRGTLIPAPVSIPRFAVGECVSHPLSNQIGQIAGKPRPWSTGLKWPVKWLRRANGVLYWTTWYTEVWQEELVSIQ